MRMEHSQTELLRGRTGYVWRSATFVESLRGHHIAAGPGLGNIVFRVANNGDVYSRGQLLLGSPTIAVCGYGLGGCEAACAGRVIVRSIGVIPAGCSVTADRPPA